MDFVGVLLDLSLRHSILAVTTIIAIIPAIPLINLYRSTMIKEYLQFASVFFLSSLFCISIIGAELTDSLIFWQITFTTRNLTYFLFFIHVSRMLYRNPPWYINYTGVIFYAIIQFSILIWKHNPNGEGAGLYLLDGTAIFSTEFRLISLLFQLFVATLFFYGFYAVRVENPTNNVRLSRLIMTSMAFLLFVTRLYRLLQLVGILPESQSTEVLGSSLLVFGFLIIGMVFILDPAAIMLSRVQIGGILVLTEDGLPVSSFKFEESALSISPMLLGGIISAIDSVVKELVSDKNERILQEIEAKNRIILIHNHGGLTFSIITNERTTKLLQSSLRYFSRTYVSEYADELDMFLKTGSKIKTQEIFPQIKAAFPYTSGLNLQTWDD